MSGAELARFEGFIVLGLVLGLGIWQLVSVRREIARDRERERERAQNAVPASTPAPPAD